MRLEEHPDAYPDLLYLDFLTNRRQQPIYFRRICSILHQHPKNSPDKTSHHCICIHVYGFAAFFTHQFLHKHNLEGQELYVCWRHIFDCGLEEIS